MDKDIQALVNDGMLDVHRVFDEFPEPFQDHCHRVARMSARLLEYVEEVLWVDEVFPLLSHEEVYESVKMFDIGMCLIPERLLKKEDALTPSEKKVVMRHARYGAKLLEEYRKINKTEKSDEFWELAIEVANSHHERWDGYGYPHGEMSTGISLLPRIVTMFDSYDSIVRGSSFRMPLPPEYAMLELIDNSGSQFDPRLIAIFKEHYKDIVSFCK